MKRQEELMKSIARLKYQASKYQLLGNGSMSQQLTMKIRQLQEEANEAVQY